jgi:hypothetical protein
MVITDFSVKKHSPRKHGAAAAHPKIRIISRKAAKAAKKNSYPNLALFAPWREKLRIREPCPGEICANM